MHRIAEGCYCIVTAVLRRFVTLYFDHVLDIVAGRVCFAVLARTSVTAHNKSKRLLPLLPLFIRQLKLFRGN